MAVGWLLGGFSGGFCCCFELFCFVSPGFLVGMFVAGCFVDLWVSEGLVLGCLCYVFGCVCFAIVCD